MCPIKSLMTVFLPYILQDERQEDKQQVLIPVMQQELQQCRFSPAAPQGGLRIGRQLLQLPHWVRQAERFTRLKVKHTKKKALVPIWLFIWIFKHGLRKARSEESLTHKNLLHNSGKHNRSKAVRLVT